MKDSTRRQLGKRSTTPQRDQCVFCSEVHMAIDLNGRGRDTWNCRRCRGVNVTVDYRGQHFTRAATRLERAEKRIKDHGASRRLFDPKTLQMPHPGHFQPLAVAAREELLARIAALEKAHKARGLSIVMSWDFQPGTWGASVAFNPKSGFGRGYIQAYGAPTAEQLVEGMEKRFNVDRILDDDDLKFNFTVSRDLIDRIRLQRIP